MTVRWYTHISFHVQLTGHRDRLSESRVTIPSDLERLIDEALRDMREHPSHQLAAARRRVIYEAFGTKSDPIASRARGWLGIFVARHVLPIFQEALPHEDLPQRLLEMAEGVVRGAVDAKIAIQEASEGHEVAGRLWGYEEADVPWNAYFAGSSADRALVEAAGWDPFQYLDRFHRVDLTSGSDVQDEQTDRWNDEELAQIGGDTASAAAVAYACGVGSPGCDPDKLREFWEWWLTQAIPEAWRAATH